ncbi:MAG: hypothetical protein RIS94_2016, partial [Pseudomonadota bacterium]
ALDDSELGAVLEQLKRDGFAGFNVTFPFKQAILPLLDELDESAAMVGAVNTVAIRNGRLIGHNTDMAGFRDSVKQGLPGASLRHVVQMGAGGAGAAVASALLSLGVQTLELVDVDATRSEALRADLGERFPHRAIKVTMPDALDTHGADGIVNATPIGMNGKPGLPLPADKVQSQHWLADIIYFPPETELLRVARSKGCKAINGVGMVVSQAARAFRIITGHEADAARMAASLV